MARRSPRKKAVSPEAVADSSDENFIAVASDDQYASPLLYSTKISSFTLR